VQLLEVPKVKKCLNCLKLRYTVNFIKKESQEILRRYFSEHPKVKHPPSIKKTERSDTTILGILDNLGILGIC
jgi:hypothetical protein